MPVLHACGVGLVAVIPRKSDGSLNSTAMNGLTLAVISDAADTMANGLSGQTRPSTKAVYAEHTSVHGASERNADGVKPACPCRQVGAFR